MDIIRKLRELRELRGLTQRDVAIKSGVGVKTISSFETGDRIGAMTVVQLQKLLAVYGVTECDFFGSAVELEIAPWQQPKVSVIGALVRDLEGLPLSVREPTLEKIRLVVDLARDIAAAVTHSVAPTRPSRSVDTASHRR